jgi:hypothetical protein
MENKIAYQPFIVDKAEEIVDALNKDGFFEEFGIEEKGYAINTFCQKLTEQFIAGEFGQGGNPMFTEESMSETLSTIVAGSLLEQLKKKGFVGSYEDDETEEVFFLTQEGKEMAKALNLKK